MKKFISVLIVVILLGSPCMAFNSRDLDVTVTQIPLATQLKKYYNGYEYTLTNVSKTKINIANAQVVNGNDGSIAFTNTMNNEPSAMARTWMIAGPIGLVTLGIGWIAGLLATPFVAIVSSNNKKKTQSESLSYTNMVTLGYLNAGDATTVSTLVPIGSKPLLKLTVQDTKTGNLHSVSY